MGYHDQLLDILDRRPLTKNELYDFFMLLFGNAGSISDTTSSKNLNSTLYSDTDEDKEEVCRHYFGNDLPNPSIDWYGFMKCLTKASEEEALHWVRKYNRIYMLNCYDCSLLCTFFLE